MKTKDKKKYIQLVLAVLAALIIEIVISNHTAIGMMLSNNEKKELTIDKSVTGDYITVTEDDPAFFKDVDTEMKTVMLTLDGDYFEYVNVTVAFTDDNFRFDDAYKYNTATTLMRSGLGSRNFVTLSSYGKVGTIRITSETPVNITEVKVNAIPDLRFSGLRFLAVLALICGGAFGLWKKPLGRHGQLYIKFCAAVLSAVVLASGGIISSLCGEPLLMELPENVTKQDEYTQLFDAFHSGRLDLAIDYDIAKLEAVSDPYDRSERNENDLHGTFWDRAFYNGKFYSYFGAAPVFTVYYPVWLLTSHIPSPLFASAILCVYCIVFISLLYGLFIKRFCRSVPALLAILGQCALIFGSSVIAIASEAQFYFMAVLSGIASAAAFLFFLFKAYFSDSFRNRLILLALAGVSCALIAASRPTLLLYCFIALIPAADIFKDKRETAKHKAAYVLAVGLPVLCGAVLIMAYNYARFDDPFEFGFNYQLTVSKAQANTIKLAMLPSALYHYFIQQPGIISSFPYIEIRKNALDSYTRYSYSGCTMGIFSYPLTWGVLLLPFLRCKDKVKRAVMLALPSACVMMAFIDMCKAGSHYRYTADILFLFLPVALIAIFDLLSIIKERFSSAYKAAYIFTAAAMCATIILGILLIFANEGDTMTVDYAYATEFFRAL